MAERTDRNGCDLRRGDAVGSQEFGVGLEENLKDEFDQGFGRGVLGVLVGGVLDLGTEGVGGSGDGPIFVHERDPGGWALQRKLARYFSDWCGADVPEQQENSGEGWGER